MVKIIAGFRDKLIDVICPAGPGYNGEHVEELTEANSLEKEARIKSKKTK